MDSSIIFKQFSMLPEHLKQEAADFIAFLSQKSKPQVSNEREPVTSKKPSDFAGTLSKEIGAKILADVNDSRSEWERGV